MLLRLRIAWPERPGFGRHALPPLHTAAIPLLRRARRRARHGGAHPFERDRRRYLFCI